MDELFSFLRSERADVQQEALKILLSISKEASLHEYLHANPNELQPILRASSASSAAKNTQNNAEIRHLGIQILINLSTISLLNNPNILSQFISPNFLFRELMHLIVLPKSPFADLGCMLLSNLSQHPETCSSLLNVSPGSQNTHLDHLITVFDRGVGGKYNQNATFHWLSNVFANVAMSEQGRRALLSDAEGNTGGEIRLSRIICFLEHDNLYRRGGCISTLKNVAFQTDAHFSLLTNPSLNLLAYILLPLAGPEDLSDEDMDGMPAELQLLEPTKTREPEAVLRKYLLETLVLFCATRNGRDILRQKKVYPILRELDQWEQSTENKEEILKLVNLLMRDEAPDTQDESNGNDDAMVKTKRIKLSEQTVVDDADDDTMEGFEEL